MLMIKGVPLFNVIAIPAFARMNTATGDRSDYSITTLGSACTFIFLIFYGATKVVGELIGLVLSDSLAQIAGLFAITVTNVPIRIIAHAITLAVFASSVVKVAMSGYFHTTHVLFSMILVLLFLRFPGVATAWSIASLCLFMLTVVWDRHLLTLPIQAMLSVILPALFTGLVVDAAIYYIDQQFSSLSRLVALYKMTFGGIIYALIFLTF